MELHDQTKHKAHKLTDDHIDELGAGSLSVSEYSDDESVYTEEL